MDGGSRTRLSIEWTVVRFHLRRFAAWVISFSPHRLCLSEEILRVIGPFYLVSVAGEVNDKNHWSLLSGLCAREVKDPTQGNGETVMDSLTVEMDILK